MSLDSKVQVLSSEEEKVLFECDVHESEKAFEYAAEMERMGIEVKIVSPTITETLCETLGLTLDEKDEYQQSVTAEIHDHDGGCCASDSDAPKKTLQ